MAISVLIIFAFMKISKFPWSMLGFKKVDQWSKMLITSAGLAFVLALSFFFFIIPVIEMVTSRPLDYSIFKELTRDTTTTMLIIPVVWITAAFFEEVVFRGFFITLPHYLFPYDKQLLLTMILSTFLFGLAHSHQGLTGVIVTGMVGLLLSLILVKTKFNIPFLILIHGFIDTIYLLLFYFNIAD
jgi:membrane protease YdiL (CAAX protease family)